MLTKIDLSKIDHLVSKRINEEIQPLSKKIDTMDKKIGTIDKRLNNMDKKIGTMDKRLKRVEDKVNIIGTSMDNQLLYTQKRVRLIEKHLDLPTPEPFEI